MMTLMGQLAWLITAADRSFARLSGLSTTVENEPSAAAGSPGPTDPGSSDLSGQRASLGWGPPVLAGTRPLYPTALVDRVAEPKSVAALVFCQTVIAFRPGIIPSCRLRLNPLIYRR